MWGCALTPPQPVSRHARHPASTSSTGRRAAPEPLPVEGEGLTAPPLAPPRPRLALLARPAAPQKTDISLGGQDHALLRVLAKDGRAGYELAAASGLSHTTVRLEQLRSSGALRFHIEIPAQALTAGASNRSAEIPVHEQLTMRGIPQALVRLGSLAQRYPPAPAMLDQQHVLKRFVEDPDLCRERVHRTLHRRLQPGARVVVLGFCPAGVHHGCPQGVLVRPTLIHPPQGWPGRPARSRTRS